MSAPVTDPAAIIRHARLDQCRGPWLVDAQGRTWFDATARLGTSPLGYNAAANFGVCQFAETWTGELETENVRGVQNALRALLKRTSPKNSRHGGPNNDLDPGLQRPGGVDDFQTADLIRSYIEANCLDQFQDVVAKTGAASLEHVENLAQRSPGVVRSWHVDGLAIDLSFAGASQRDEFVLRLARAGILAEPAGEDSVAIRFSLGCRPQDLNWFWDVIRAAEPSTEPFGRRPMKVRALLESQGWPREVDALVAFQRQLIDCKSSPACLKPDQRAAAVTHYLAECIAVTSATDAIVTLVDSESWPRFRDRVQVIQAEVYEPARRTSLQTFDALMACPVHHAIVLELDGKLIAIVFAASLSCFPNERGTLDDPARARPDVIYVADLTVDAGFRGGLGRIMKQAITLDAVLAGREAFHGRNRDRLAAGMWAINLGLGSYELKHLVDDYPDDKPFRDCIYYRCPLRWEPDQAAKVAAELDRLGEQGFRQKMFELANGR